MTDKLKFTVREHYADGEHVKVRTVEVTGSRELSETGYYKYELTRTDTGEELFPMDLDRFELVEAREFVARGPYCWGKGPTVADALRKMMSYGSATKAQLRKLEHVRHIDVFECVQGTGGVDDMGGCSGLMMDTVGASRWMGDLWDIVQPKRK